MILRYILCVFAFISSLFCNEILLLKEYNDENLSGFVMSEKLDGIRGYWDGKRLMSRNGNDFNPPEFWTVNFPDFAIDGELWSGRGEFEKISSIVSSSKDKERWNEIKFMIFDVPDANGTLKERLGVLKSFLDKNPNEFIKIISQYEVSDKASAYSFLNEALSLGGEGIVLRKNDAPYERFRSSNALKLKPTNDSECEVIAINKGKGKNSGKMGSVTCKDESVTFKVGSGWSDDDRTNPPKIGDTITYEYRGLTKNGIPRFPTFLRYKKEF
ncbi:MAG: DNA ligase [Campylobacter sp.]|nr:DNA ligase [Campylobacter sp.]